MPIASVGAEWLAIVLGQRQGFLERAALGNHAVDEAEAFGLRGGVEPAGQRHLHRLLARHDAADRDQRRRAEQPVIHARQAEARMLSGDRKIAGGDELAARRGRDALDRRDDRLRQRDDRLHERRAAREQFDIKVAAPIAIVAMRLHLLEVMAGAERLSGAGEHDDARLVVIGDVVERGDQGLDHGEAQRIAVLRRVQSQMTTPLSSSRLMSSGDAATADEAVISYSRLR